MPKVLIVGGGISGLALAWRLQQQAPAVEVQVLEAAAQPGGKVDTTCRDGFRVEGGPNGFLDNNPSTLTLCRELGLGDRLVSASEASGRNRYLLLGGRLRALPNSLGSFLRSDVLSWRGKLSLLAERFRPPRAAGGDESVDAFARRRAGREVAETLADAFVTGIHAGDPSLLSVRAAFPRLAAFEREHGSVQRGMAAARKRRRAEAAAAGQPPPGPPKLWSFREGLGLLTDTLRDRLRTPPLTGASVHSLRRTGGAWEVRGEGQERWAADAVVLTCPAKEQAEILGEADAELTAKIGGIAYNRVAVVALGYHAADVPRSLDGFGYLSPQRERRDVLGVQWCSSIFPGRAPPGLVLLRALCGGWHRPEVVDWPWPRLLEAVRAELTVTMGVRAEPVFFHVVRWDRAIPQYHLGHLDRLSWIEERVGRHPGLFLGGNCYHGVALNDCVEQAGLLAGRVAAWLAARNPQGPHHLTARPGGA
jgi:protoporphyrinogen/coproporphyrinogen III oxidase